MLVMDIELNIVPGDIVYYRVSTGLAIAVNVSKVAGVNISLTESTENKTYLLSTSNGNVNIPEGNITKDRKEAMHWLQENLEFQTSKYVITKKTVIVAS